MGYRWIGNNRKCINRRAKSGSGGVGILVSDHLYKRFHIEKVDDSYEGILAVSFTDICPDYSFVLFTLYLPPENSLYGRDSAKFYSKLMTLVYQCVAFDALYFAGDVNGRIGDQLDFIEEVDPVPHRISIDHVFNHHGQGLLDFCNDAKLCTINGRFNSSQDGFTSVSSKGSAVVDYFLCGHDNLINIHNFGVITMFTIIDQLGVGGIATKPETISDHSVLIVDFDPWDMSYHSMGSETAQSETTYPDTTFNRNVKATPPVRFKVKQVPVDFLQSEISRNTFIEMIDKIENNRGTQEEINGIYNENNSTYNNEMAIHFQPISGTPTSKKQHRLSTKPWWNEALKSLWTNMHQAEHDYLKCKKHKRPYRRLLFEYKAKQDRFDKACKREKRKYQRALSLQVEDICTSDPSSFWDCIKNLGPRKKVNTPLQCYGEMEK